ncbi:hypothetical protein BD413DRAFT_114217 [Trametes elegans]|nr:hypothetical protein BD413DRAFT_114217 [Trametes elegans]
MMTWEGNGRGDNTAHEDTQFDIDREYPISSPMSHAHKRFIVEPQVLNAAFEFELGERRGSADGAVTAPSLPVPGGGLPPPPRGLPPPPRPNSHRGKPINPNSTPSSPTASLNNSIASVPNSPTSSPYSNSPNTPGSSDPGPNVKPSPRLSNLLRGESLIFSAHRRSSTDPDGLYDQREDENEGSQSAHQWTSHYMGESFSPLDSVPSSPEPGTPADESRPSRQNRYLSGLQKIKKLGGKATGILADAGVRSTRRMSDADLDSGRSSSNQEAHKGSVDLTARYRRMLEAAGVSKAGEPMRPPTSVPSSPIAPAPAVKSRLFP